MKQLIILLLVGVTSCFAACTPKNPQTYTTTDSSILTSIAYITQFKLEDCGNTKSNLYALITTTNEVIQIARSEDNLLISWTSELASATKGDHVVKIYNEEGVGKLRKVLGSGGSVEALTQFTVNHPGAWNGPWLNSEHLAAGMGIFVGYLAISGKSRLLSG